jgi:hypothetical protein
MQLVHRSNNLTTNLDTSKTSSFTFTASAKFFQIFSNQLYSNKPVAILRELGANAVDSHRAAGKADQPFHVHLPTSLDSSLRIRDYGTGMSEEFIMARYNSYGDSSKNDNNDDIGGLGLGSKTPLAYADTFQVTSWYAGEKKTYIAFLDPQGTPAINGPVTCEPCGNETGVEISMAVHANDRSTFINAATTTYYWFEPRPIINTPISALTWLTKTDYYGIRANGGYRAVHVLMGPIAYPLNLALIEEALVRQQDDEALRKVRSLFATSGLCLFAPIGSVDITPSRESLSYDKQSIAKIVELLITTADRIRDDVQDQLDRCECMFDAYLTRRALNRVSSFAFIASREPSEDLTWRGKPLYHAIAWQYGLTADLTSSFYNGRGRAAKLTFTRDYEWSPGLNNFKAPTIIHVDKSIPNTRFIATLKHNRNAILGNADAAIVVKDVTPAQLVNIRLLFDDRATIIPFSSLAAPPAPQQTAKNSSGSAGPRKTTRFAPLDVYTLHTDGQLCVDLEQIPLNQPLANTCYIVKYKNSSKHVNYLIEQLADPLLLNNMRVVVIPEHHKKTLADIQCPSRDDVLRERFIALTDTYLNPARAKAAQAFLQSINVRYMLMYATELEATNYYYKQPLALRDLCAAVREAEAHARELWKYYSLFNEAAVLAVEPIEHDPYFDSVLEQIPDTLLHYPLIEADLDIYITRPRYQYDFPTVFSTFAFMQYLKQLDTQQDPFS